MRDGGFSAVRHGRGGPLWATPVGTDGHTEGQSQRQGCMAFVVLKGTGSWDGLDLCWHARVDLSINGDRDRWLTFSPLSSKNNIFLYISCGKCKPHSATLCYRRMFGRNTLAFYWPRQQKHSFPLTGGICKFYAILFDHLLFLCWLEFVRHQQQAHQLLCLGNYFPTLDKLCLQK